MEDYSISEDGNLLLDKIAEEYGEDIKDELLRCAYDNAEELYGEPLIDTYNIYYCIYKSKNKYVEIPNFLFKAKEDKTKLIQHMIENEDKTFQNGALYAINDFISVYPEYTIDEIVDLLPDNITVEDVIELQERLRI
ncbi:MAG: hypothetical protein QW478_00430 [Candidatus Micrarchaeaceae archaeon]